MKKIVTLATLLTCLSVLAFAERGIGLGNSDDGAILLNFDYANETYFEFDEPVHINSKTCQIVFEAANDQWSPYLIQNKKYDRETGKFLFDYAVKEGKIIRDKPRDTAISEVVKGGKAKYVCTEKTQVVSSYGEWVKLSEEMGFSVSTTDYLKNKTRFLNLTKVEYKNKTYYNHSSEKVGEATQVFEGLRLGKAENEFSHQIGEANFLGLSKHPEAYSAFLNALHFNLKASVNKINIHLMFEFDSTNTLIHSDSLRMRFGPSYNSYTTIRIIPTAGMKALLVAYNSLLKRHGLDEMIRIAGERSLLARVYNLERDLSVLTKFAKLVYRDGNLEIQESLLSRLIQEQLSVLISNAAAEVRDALNIADISVSDFFSNKDDRSQEDEFQKIYRLATGRGFSDSTNEEIKFLEELNTSLKTSLVALGTVLNKIDRMKPNIKKYSSAGCIYILNITKMLKEFNNKYLQFLPATVKLSKKREYLDAITNVVITVDNSGYQGGSPEEFLNTILPSWENVCSNSNDIRKEVEEFINR